MDLSVLIVNWNTRTLTLKCVDSVYGTTTGLDFEVIVVDNGSTDGSPRAIRERFPEVHIIENDKNVGFAPAVNQGLALARGRYILLLNSDAEVLPSSLESMMRFMDQHSDAGAIGPKLLNSNGTEQHPAYLSFTSPFSEFVYNFLPRRVHGLFSPPGCYYTAYGLARDQVKAPQQVAHLTGACLLLRASLLEKVGVLDDRLFFSYEDADLCYRLAEEGWKTYYLPDISIVHHGGKSVELIPRVVVGMILNSKYAFFKKLYGQRAVCMLWVILASASLMRSALNLVRFCFGKNQRRLAQVRQDMLVLRWHLGRLLVIGEKRHGTG